MKALFLMAALLAANVATASSLGTLRFKYYEDVSKTVSLGECNGSLEIRQAILSSAGISVVGNDNCTNVIVNNAQVKATEGFFSGVRRAFVPLLIVDNRENIFDVVLKSNSGKTADFIRVIVDTRRAPSYSGAAMGIDATLVSGQATALPDCKGTVSFKLQNRQANIVFRAVNQCSNFDILAANGQPMNYANKKLGGENGARGGSFTLPQEAIDFGSNSVIVVVKSNSGKTEDRIRLRFSAR